MMDWRSVFGRKASARKASIGAALTAGCNPDSVLRACTRASASSISTVAAARSCPVPGTLRRSAWRASILMSCSIALIGTRPCDESSAIARSSARRAASKPAAPYSAYSRPSACSTSVRSAQFGGRRPRRRRMRLLSASKSRSALLAPGRRVSRRSCSSQSSNSSAASSGASSRVAPALRRSWKAGSP